MEAYASLAETIVSRLDVPRFIGRYSDSLSTGDANLRRIISQAGKWILRGPLTPTETDNFLNVSRAVLKEGGKFEEAVEFVLEAMLQSPRFLYRMENEQTKGQPRPVSDYELASRLSYILWGGPPDEELMQAADRGDLSDERKLNQQVDRMLQDPRAVDRSSRFLYEWLDLDRMDYLRPNRKHFPKWDPVLADDMRRETLEFFREVAWRQRRPLWDLLNAQVTFVTPRLAKHYGIKQDGKQRQPSDQLGKLDVSQIPGRGGLLTHGSVLTVGGDEASMVTRGLFVLHDLLRGEVDDPPPCVDTTPVPTKPGLSQRSIAVQRLANDSCGGCHSTFEPLAFGLERFDGLGSYYEKDQHGNTLREDGEILFPEATETVKYKTSAEMMNLLAASDRVRECITWKVTQFALGRRLTASDKSHVTRIHRAAVKSGGTYADLIKEIVLSDLVRKTRASPASDER